APLRSLPSFPTRRSSDLLLLGSEPTWLADRPFTSAAPIARRCRACLTCSAPSCEPGMTLNCLSWGRAERATPPRACCAGAAPVRSEEHTSELQSLAYLVC